VELKNKPRKDRFFSKTEMAEDLKNNFGKLKTSKPCWKAIKTEFY
jgi:hypothetical protein